MAASVTRPPIQLDLAHEPDDVLIVRAAWLYYVAGLNQEETAARLGLHRTRVTRLLSEARDRGLVSITIEHDAARDLATEQAIVGLYGLEFCIATPPVGFADAAADATVAEAQGLIARRAVGSAGASFLKGQLGRGPMTIGVSWGRTIEQVALQLSGVRNPGATFVSLMGSLTRNSASNPFEVVQALAARTGGEGHFLPVPFIADTLSDRDVLMSQRSVAEALDLARSADLFLISVGELTAGAFLRRQNMLSDDELASIRSLGAVADSLGQLFDRRGQVVEHEISRRTLALDLACLRSRRVVLLGAGLQKVEAMHALLSTGLISALIVDGDAARRPGRLPSRSAGGRTSPVLTGGRLDATPRGRPRPARPSRNRSAATAAGRAARRVRSGGLRRASARDRSCRPDGLPARPRPSPPTGSSSTRVACAPHCRRPPGPA